MKIGTNSLIIFLLLFSGSLFAQPKLTIHVTGGYGAPLGDFKVDVPATTRADADNFPFYTKHDIAIGADGKLAIGKMGNFRAVFGVTYNMFSNNTDAVFYADSNKTLITTNFKPKVNILSVYLGGEWAFLPKGKINPFIGLDIVGNFFGGSFEFGQSVFVKGAQRTGPMDMKAETRIGFLLDAGVDFMLSKRVGAVVGAKYHMINPLGKGADVESEVGPNEIDLGDKSHVRDDNTTSPDLSLSAVNLYAGVSFYFGSPKAQTKQ